MCTVLIPNKSKHIKFIQLLYAWELMEDNRESKLAGQIFCEIS